ncbi:tetratricopeptide repeat protein [Henriciella aquimarina]|uniref:tetratricopeptide repeat protein n=1 Tax=Henriciella aquimarina TaxID=545261 RepID=UPI0009FBE6DE|nr:tetratricopeptide repeat protein [Henriciella aquimarina]
MYRPLVTGAVAAITAASAAAQVFVVGGGLAKECYELAKTGNYQARTAEQTCTRAIREETMDRKNRAATYVNRGVIRMREGNYAPALEDYDKAIETQPELGAAYLNKGAAHIYMKEFDSALAPLNRAIELQSVQLHAAYYNRAIARENTGDVPGAYYDFQKALELKPDWALAEKQLARFTVKSQ